MAIVITAAAIAAATSRIAATMSTRAFIESAGNGRGSAAKAECGAADGLDDAVSAGAVLAGIIACFVIFAGVCWGISNLESRISDSV